MNINVLGAGAWGIALSSLLSKNDHSVTVWLRDQKKVKDYSDNRFYSNLNDYKIPSSISFTSRINSLNFKNLTIIAVPSHSIFEILKNVDLSNGRFLIASKGFDLKTSYLPS